MLLSKLLASLLACAGGGGAAHSINYGHLSDTTSAIETTTEVSSTGTGDDGFETWTTVTSTSTLTSTLVDLPTSSSSTSSDGGGKYESSADPSNTKTETEYTRTTATDNPTNYSSSRTISPSSTDTSGTDEGLPISTGDASKVGQSSIALTNSDLTSSTTHSGFSSIPAATDINTTSSQDSDGDLPVATTDTSPAEDSSATATHAVTSNDGDSEEGLSTWTTITVSDMISTTTGIDATTNENDMSTTREGGTGPTAIVTSSSSLDPGSSTTTMVIGSTTLSFSFPPRPSSTPGVVTIVTTDDQVYTLTNPLVATGAPDFTTTVTDEETIRTFTLPAAITGTPYPTTVTRDESTWTFTLDSSPTGSEAIPVTVTSDGASVTLLLPPSLPASVSGTPTSVTTTGSTLGDTTSGATTSTAAEPEDTYDPDYFGYGNPEKSADDDTNTPSETGDADGTKTDDDTVPSETEDADATETSYGDWPLDKEAVIRKFPTMWLEIEGVDYYVPNPEEDPDLDPRAPLFLSNDKMGYLSNKKLVIDGEEFPIPDSVEQEGIVAKIGGISIKLKPREVKELDKKPKGCFFLDIPCILHKAAQILGKLLNISTASIREASGMLNSVGALAMAGGAQAMGELIEMHDLGPKLVQAQVDHSNTLNKADEIAKQQQLDENFKAKGRTFDAKNIGRTKVNYQINNVLKNLGKRFQHMSEAHMERFLESFKDHWEEIKALLYSTSGRLYPIALNEWQLAVGAGAGAAITSPIWTSTVTLKDKAKKKDKKRPFYFRLKKEVWWPFWMAFKWNVDYMQGATSDDDFAIGPWLGPSYYTRVSTQKGMDICKSRMVEVCWALPTADELAAKGWPSWTSPEDTRTFDTDEKPSEDPHEDSRTARPARDTITKPRDETDQYLRVISARRGEGDPDGYTMRTEQGSGSWVIVIDGGLNDHIYPDEFDLTARTVRKEFLDAEHHLEVASERERTVLGYSVVPADHLDRGGCSPAKAPCDISALVGHGTEMAIKAVGSRSGVAPLANLVSIKYTSEVVDPQGKIVRTRSEPPAILAAINRAMYLVRSGAIPARKTVINISAGALMDLFTRNYGLYPATIFRDFMEQFVWEAEALGVTVVTSAGNKGTDIQKLITTQLPSGLAEETNGLIAVGAVNVAGQFWPSTLHRNIPGGADRTIKIWAPGAEVKGFHASVRGLAVIKSGTSGAAAMVAGLVAYFHSLPELDFSPAGQLSTALRMKRHIENLAYERVPPKLPRNISRDRERSMSPHLVVSLQCPFVPRDLRMIYNGVHGPQKANECQPQRLLAQKEAELDAPNDEPDETCPVEEPEYIPEWAMPNLTTIGNFTLPVGNSSYTISGDPATMVPDVPTGVMTTTEFTDSLGSTITNVVEASGEPASVPTDPTSTVEFTTSDTKNSASTSAVTTSMGPTLTGSSDSISTTDLASASETPETTRHSSSGTTTDTSTFQEPSGPMDTSTSISTPTSTSAPQASESESLPATSTSTQQDATTGTSAEGPIFITVSLTITSSSRSETTKTTRTPIQITVHTDFPHA